MATEQKKNPEIDTRLNKWMEQNKEYVSKLGRSTKADLVRKVCVRDMLRAEEKQVASQRFELTLERFVASQPKLAEYIKKETEGLSPEEAMAKRKNIARGALKKARTQKTENRPVQK